MNRRGHNEGSVYFDKSKQRFVASVSLGSDIDGSRRRVKRTSKTRSGAVAHLKRMTSEELDGRLTDNTSMTLAAFTDFWLNTEASGQVRETTISGYWFLMRKYVLPSFGHRRLSDITSMQVAEWVKALSSRGYSTNTIKRARGALHNAFEHALEHDLVRMNPVKRVKPPKRKPNEPTQVREALSLDEAIGLLDLTRGTDLDAFVTIAIYTGMRRGEILGLKWKDIDLKAGRIQIRRTLAEGTKVLPDGSGITRPVVNQPKTRNSARDLMIPAAVIESLVRRRATQRRDRLAAGDYWLAGDDSQDLFVFTNPVGGAVYPSNVQQKFKRFCKRNNFRYVRIHDLRHTAAHLMLEAGARLEAVSQALGHSSPAFTKTVYAGYVQPLADEATSLLADSLSERPNLNHLKRAVGETTTEQRIPFEVQSPKWHGDR